MGSEVTANSNKISLWSRENIMELDSNDGCSTTELFTLKG